jgi:hypothetical protein
MFTYAIYNWLIAQVKKHYFFHAVSLSCVYISLRVRNTRWRISLDGLHCMKISHCVGCKENLRRYFGCPFSQARCKRQTEDVSMWHKFVEYT